MTNPDNTCKEFWQWVATKRANDNPRGDFIEDTRSILNINIDPCTRLDRIRVNNAAQKEYKKLEREWKRAKGIAEGSFVHSP